MQASFCSLIVLAIISHISAFKPCSVIKFSDYSFDLTSLQPIYTVAFHNNMGFAKIFGCNPNSCDSTGQKGFMLSTSNNFCQPYTINSTLLSSFSYIDSSQPKNGIKINYPSYLSTTSTINDTSNLTVITKTTYNGILNIFCSTSTSQQEGCSQSIGSSTTNTVNGVLQVSSTNILICNISTTTGCPTLTINNFWSFLSNNALWFSIPLWIISVFELFMGYFVIRLTILIYGIMTGAVFGIIFSAQNYVDSFYDDSSNSIRVFIVLLSCLMGLLFGMGLLTLPKLGYLNIGMWDAIIFTLLLQNSVLYQTGSMVAFYITLGVTCLVMAAVSLLGFRKFIIFSTAFISAFWIVRTLGFVLPYYPNQFASEKLFAINEATPWQFYLYLISIIVLAILGGTFQFCWYKKKGTDHGNKGYYLEDDDNLKQKFKKLLQFDDIKNIINAGKDEVMFLKNLVIENDDSDNDENHKVKAKPKEIEMSKMNKLKKEKANSSGKRKTYNEEEDYGRKMKKVDSSASEEDEGQNKKKNQPAKKTNQAKSNPKQSGQKKIVQQGSQSEQQSEIQMKRVKVKGKK